MPENNNVGNKIITEEQIDKYQELVEKQEDKILKLESSVFQLANYYFVFAGVVLSVVGKGSDSLKCRHAYFPFLMLVFGAILNLSTLIIISSKYMEALKRLDERTHKWTTALEKANDLQGNESQTMDLVHEPAYSENNKKNKWRKFGMCSSLGIFFCFVVLILVAIIVIPCSI